MKLKKIVYIISLLLVVFMVGCNSKNTVSYNLDGKYCAKHIYDLFYYGESTSILEIKDNKIDGSEIVETTLQWDFSVGLNDSTELSYKKDTKCYYVELNANDDYRFGYYLFNQDELYLFSIHYSEKSGYEVFCGLELSNVNEYLNKDHYYIYRNGYGSTAYDENGSKTESLELIKTKEQLYKYCEKYIFIKSSLNVESYLAKLCLMDSDFFDKYEIIIYTTFVNVDHSLIFDSVNVQDDKVIINMKYITPDDFYLTVVRPWSTIVVVEKSLINGANDVVVERTK